jgi:hypothetical protein
VEETDAQGFMRELNRRPCSLTGVHELDTATDAREKKQRRQNLQEKASTVTCATETKEELQQNVKNRTRPKKESWASKQI